MSQTYCTQSIAQPRTPMIWLVYADSDILSSQFARLGIQSNDKIMIASSTQEFYKAISPNSTSGPDDMMLDTGLLTPPCSTPRSHSPVRHFESEGYGFYHMGNIYEISEIGLPTPARRPKRSYRETDDSEARDYLPKMRPKSLSLSQWGTPQPFIWRGSTFNIECYRLKCDIRNTASVSFALEKCAQVFGRVDAIVTCCGATGFQDPVDQVSNTTLLLNAAQAILTYPQHSNQFRHQAPGTPREFINFQKSSDIDEEYLQTLFLVSAEVQGRGCSFTNFD